MTISELAAVSHVKEKTVIRNTNKIAGVLTDDNGIVVFPCGSRYPFNLRGNKLDTAGKRRLALLDATYRYQYIDHDMLHMTMESFSTMVNELLRVGYLQENGSGNPYGVNKYDTTIRYEQLRELPKSTQAKRIADDLASIAGHFVGAVICETA